MLKNYNSDYFSLSTHLGYMMFAFTWLTNHLLFQTSCFLGPKIAPTAPTQSVKRPENTQTFLNLDTNVNFD